MTASPQPYSRPSNAASSDSAQIVCRVIRLDANPQHAGLAHGVAAARDVAESGGRQHQILVAHDLGNGGCNLRDDGPLQPPQFRIARGIIQQILPQLAHRHAAQTLKRFPIQRPQDQLGDIVVNERLVDDLGQAEVGKLLLRRHALALRSRCQAGHLVAGFFFVGFGEQLAQITKRELLASFTTTRRS